MKQYTLNYVSKHGDTIARDYFYDINKANDFVDEMIETYKHNNVDKGLILEDDNGKIIRCYEPEVLEDIMNEKQKIYDELCAVLTRYEESDDDESELLYEMLCKIQNAWEDVITAQ